MKNTTLAFFAFGSWLVALLLLFATIIPFALNLWTANPTTNLATNPTPPLWTANLWVASALGVALTLTFCGLVAWRALWQRLHLSRSEASEMRWETLAHRDELTGLLNRRGLTANLPDTPYCVVLIDIDDFKGINDSHGHAVGDSVLQHLATVLQGNSRQVDRCARWGGDEFLVLLTQADHTAGTAFVERLQAHLSATTNCQTKKANASTTATPSSQLPTFSISTGCADTTTNTHHNTTLSSIIDTADCRLLAAKRHLWARDRHNRQKYLSNLLRIKSFTSLI